MSDLQILKADNETETFDVDTNIELYISSEMEFCTVTTLISA